MTFTPDLPSTEDILKTVLSSSIPPLPPPEQELGGSVVSWWETLPGEVYIYAEGGTTDDRHYGSSLVAVQLQGHGYRRAQFDLDRDVDHLGSRRISSWPDVMAKAKRLVDSGQVHVLRNGYNYIVGHVVGDHGDYDTEISRDDPKGRSITSWNCSCLLPGGKIVMADGSIRPVEEIQTGDLVMTATGHAGIVGRTFVNQFDGTAVGLKITGSTERVWVTDNHKLVTADVEVREAGAWSGNDHSYLPAPVYTIHDEIDVSRYVADLVEDDGRLYRPNKLYGNTKVRKVSRPATAHSPRQKPIPARIALDERFARLAGLFLAEGLVTPRGELRWAFHPKETDLCDEVIELLSGYGLDNAKAKLTNHCWQVAIQSKPMAVLFEALLGTGAREKKLAPEIMTMPVTSLRVFFDAWCEGDGHVNGPRTYITTASDDLAMQARLILARLGHESVIRRQDSNVSLLVPKGGSINHVAWRTAGNQVALRGDQWGSTGHTARRLNRYYDSERSQVTQRMEPCEYKPYIGPVYNFEVLDEHSYVIAPGIASLNCPWDQYAWQRTRKWKKFEGRPCAHVLALYWKALGTPLDEQLTQEQAEAMGTGQKLPAPAVPEHPPEVEDRILKGEKPPEGLPRSFSPEGEPIPGEQHRMFGPEPPEAVGGPAQSPLAPPPPEGPQPPGILPPFPGEQMQMPWQGPGTTPGGGVSPPGAYTVPGAKPPNQPANPVQNPGTYSKNTSDVQPPQVVRLKNDAIGVAEGPEKGQYGDGEYREIPKGTTGEVRSVDPSTGWIEAIFPLDNSGYHEPFHVRVFLEPSEVEETGLSNAFIRRHTSA